MVMDDNSAGAQEPVPAFEQPFFAVLRPNRSLTPNGFLVLMGLLSLVSFITGLAFLMIGAWPVMGFFGLDVLIVYLAFKLNYRSGRAYETVAVDGDELKVERVAASGQLVEAVSFNSYWVRVTSDLDTQGRVAVRLVSHGRSIAIAEMLSDPERAEFADALRAALHRLKFPRF